MSSDPGWGLSLLLQNICNPVCMVAHLCNLGSTPSPAEWAQAIGIPTNDPLEHCLWLQSWLMPSKSRQKPTVPAGSQVYLESYLLQDLRPKDALILTQVDICGFFGLCPNYGVRRGNSCSLLG